MTRSSKATLAGAASPNCVTSLADTRRRPPFCNFSLKETFYVFYHTLCSMFTPRMSACYRRRGATIACAQGYLLVGQHSRPH
jgi:hypothetical protein